ncbi:uracil-DNA glycosylase family protein [Siccirubricoccus deserti]
MNAAAFEAELARRIDDAFRLNPGVGDHRPRHPWLTSSLGDPFSGVWFVAENPSLSQVQRARDPGGGPPTTEAQWLVSRGDRLFRQALVEHGFKDGPWDRRGGWRCYVTNLIKEADYAEAWKLRRERDHLRAAEAWAPVLRWQLDASRPRLVVLMGARGPSCGLPEGRCADRVAADHADRSLQLCGNAPSGEARTNASRPRGSIPVELRGRETALRRGIERCGCKQASPPAANVAEVCRHGGFDHLNEVLDGRVGIVSLSHPLGITNGGGADNDDRRSWQRSVASSPASPPRCSRALVSACPTRGHSRKT